MKVPDVLHWRQGRLERDGKAWMPQEPFLAVIGDPIAHSLSPKIQSAALSERGLAHEYLPLLVATDDLVSLKNMPGGEHLVGFNVTSPHKDMLVGLCDQLTDDAARVGSVNTVGRNAAGHWVGHNTDSGGLLMVLSQIKTEVGPTDRAVVLGTGGAARAAVDALLRWGMHEIVVGYHTSPSGERFREWLSGIELNERVHLGKLSSSLADLAGPAVVWINALARHVAISSYLPEDSAAGRSNILVDLRYGSGLPQETLPTEMTVVDGLPLLVMQGALSFAWWFNPPVPWDAMRRALQG